MHSQETIDLIRTNYPIYYLNEDEVKDPLIVIKDFFSHYHLPEMKEMLWLFFKTNITGSFPDGEALLRKERVEMVMLYELLGRLIEAVYLLNERNITA